MRHCLPPLPPEWPFEKREQFSHALPGLRELLLALPGLEGRWQWVGEGNPMERLGNLNVMPHVFGRGGLLATDQVVIRPYRRGGFVRHFNQKVYRKSERFTKELRIHRALYHAGFPTVEPIGCAFRRKVWGYEGLLITRRAEVQPWPQLWIQEAPFMESLLQGLTALRQWKLFAPDINATNIMVDASNKALLLDWDRAAFIKEDPHPRHCERLIRSLEKLNAPEAIISQVQSWR